MARSTAITLLFFLKGVLSGELDHKYKGGDEVDLWVNKVGPYANPQEAYEYYTLPYCAPESPRLHNHPKSHSLSEILGGHSLRHSGHDLIFPENKKNSKYREECTTKPLTGEEAERFSKAVREQWFYQMYLDDLPVWGMVGEILPAMEEDKKTDSEELLPYVYTERSLVISYHEDRITKVDLHSDPSSLKRAIEGTVLKFQMHVTWKHTDEVQFHTRFDRYLDHAFFKHQIHWFSIFNSFMMVLFLTGLVALIFLRTLRRDYARYSRQTESESLLEKGHTKDATDDMMESEDRGWKQVHGDVFRAPPFLPLFAALLGTGSQLFVLILAVVLFAVAGPIHGDVYEERGKILHAILLGYGLSSVVAGYVSGSYYKLFASTLKQDTIGWQATLLFTVLLLPLTVVSIFSFLNMVSVYYDTINTIPFMAIIKLFFLWIFVSVPLGVLGTLLGRHANLSKGLTTKANSFPCRVNTIPRPIPDSPWYGQPLYLVPLCGILPFGSIFIELYYVLTSLWNYKFYHVYGFMLGMYAILIIVVGMTSIISTYFCLNAENYHWQWNAFFSGASMSLYVFLYGVYYFVVKTQMHGFLQTSFYFGYMTLIALNLGVLCGTLGHWSSTKFVRTIFGNVKVD